MTQRVDVRPFVNKLEEVREQARSLEAAVRSNGGNLALVDFTLSEVIAGSKRPTQIAVHTAIAIVAGFFSHQICRAVARVRHCHTRDVRTRVLVPTTDPQRRHHRTRTHNSKRTRDRAPFVARPVLG